MQPILRGKMRPRFNVGDRVKVRIAKDVIKESEIICDEGYVMKVEQGFRGMKFERITYTVRLDRIYAERKFINAVGPIVTVSEGFNINTKLCSIEEAK